MRQLFLRFLVHQLLGVQQTQLQQQLPGCRAAAAAENASAAVAAPLPGAQKDPFPCMASKLLRLLRLPDADIFVHTPNWRLHEVLFLLRFAHTLPGKQIQERGSNSPGVKFTCFEQLLGWSSWQLQYDRPSPRGSQVATLVGRLQ